MDKAQFVEQMGRLQGELTTAENNLKKNEKRVKRAYFNHIQ